jgi:hypothetical protein
MLRYTYIANLVNHAFLQQCFRYCDSRRTAASLEVSMTTKTSPLAFTINFVTHSSEILSMAILWAHIVRVSNRRRWKRVLLGNTEGRKRFIVQLHITQIFRYSRRKIMRVLDQYMWQIVGIKYFICFISLYSFPDSFLDMSVWICPFGYVQLDKSIWICPFGYVHLSVAEMCSLAK